MKKTLLLSLFIGIVTLLTSTVLFSSSTANAASGDYYPSGLNRIKTDLCEFIHDANSPLYTPQNCGSYMGFTANDNAAKSICSALSSQELYVKQTCEKYNTEKEKRAQYTLGDFSTLCGTYNNYNTTNKAICEDMAAYLRSKGCSSLPNKPKQNQLKDFVSKCEKKVGGKKGGVKSGADPNANKKQADYKGNDCNGIATFFKYPGCDDADKTSGEKTNPIVVILLFIVNLVAAGVSLAVVGGVLYGGILYASARDNSGQTQKAIEIIANSVVGLIAFFSLWAVINFLVPGGLF